MSHRPDAMERDERDARMTMHALERRFGPREWPVSTATQADGEADEADRAKPAEYAMTLDEIGAELGVSRERARSIIVEAMRKFRAQWEILCGSAFVVERRQQAVDAALSAIKEAA